MACAASRGATIRWAIKPGLARTSAAIRPACSPNARRSGARSRGGCSLSLSIPLAYRENDIWQGNGGTLVMDAGGGDCVVVWSAGNPSLCYCRSGDAAPILVLKWVVTKRFSPDMDTITYVVRAEPGRPPSFYRLDENGAPEPVPAASLPSRLRSCGQSLHAWANGSPLPPLGLAINVLRKIPKAVPISVVVVVPRLGPYNLQ
jgi:hypothetical protein